MDAATVAETFRQIIDGDDIPQIRHLLKRMKVEQAVLVPDDWPYSILTNLAHADFWQTVWLNRLQGKPRPKFQDDWREPEPSEFEAIRDSFLTGLDKAHELSQSWPIDHGMKSDESALKTLVALAVHDAYHIGQIKLMARILAKA
ncbi:MAG: DinB family protein [Armatimonadetes bacterium]|nr:DinB family protein [Armatimonadota bacterium]